MTVLVNPFRFGGGGVTYETESQAIFDAFSTAPSTTRKAQIDAAVQHLLDGPLSGVDVWAKLDMLQVYKAADSQAARVDWIDPTRVASAVNSPTFTADQDYRFNGTNQEIDTGFNPGDGGTYSFLRNSAAFGVWESFHPGTAVGSLAGWYDGSDGVSFQLWDGGSNYGYRINQASATSGAATAGTGLGIASRSGASATSFSRGGVRHITGSAASTAVNNASLRIGRITSAGYTAGGASAALAGGALTADEEADIYNALLGYNEGVDAGETYRAEADTLHTVRNAWDSAGRHYKIVGADKLYRSDDGGATYSLVYTFPDSPQRIYGFFITSADTVLVSAEGQSTGISGRTYRSTDQGSTFTQITSFDASFRSGNIAWWGAAEDSGGDIFLGQYNVIPTKETKCIVWKSTDDGVTWADISDASWSTNDHIHNLGIDASNGWLYATMGDSTGGIWRSKLKDGTDWVRKVGTIGGNAEYLWIPLAFDGTYVYSGDDEGDGSVWRFADDGTGTGQTPTLVLNDAYEHNVYYLARDPSGLLWCCMPPSDAVGTNVRGAIYVSSNGTTWTKIYQAPPVAYASWFNGASSLWTLQHGTTQWGNQSGGTSYFPLGGTGVKVSVA